MKYLSGTVLPSLYEVLLDTAGRGHDAVDHLVLHEEPNALPDPARRHVGCVAEENGAVVAPPDELVRFQLISSQIFRDRRLSSGDLTRDATRQWHSQSGENRFSESLSLTMALI